MNWKATGAFLAVGFSAVFGVGSLVYILFTHNKGKIMFSSLRAQGQCVSQIRIPNDAIGLIIGRGGSTIKEIETKSNTKLQIRDDIESDDFKICYIRGSSENVEYAASLIRDIINSLPVIRTEEMFVPTKSCGRIIGKNGESIRLICNTSHAKITVQSVRDHPLKRKFLIKGTAQQIEFAKKLVGEKIEEELTLRNTIESHASNRSPRNMTKYLLPAEEESSEIDDDTCSGAFDATGNDRSLEVYVSAIESPDHIWVQVLGPSIVDLDKLNDQITDYYSKIENQISHILNEVNRGQIVATTFKFDGRWYRAEVLEITDNSEDPDVQVYYVDYGDTGTQKMSQLFELRTDFLQLRFQAIECMLAKVKPRDSEWTEEAIDLLEDLTHAALWKSLVAKIHNYIERPTRFKEEKSPVPCIELFQKHKNVNVGGELVRQGFAVWEKEDTSE